jgi:hypothetical protein
MKPEQPNRSTSGQKSSDFQRQAEQAPPGLVAEFIDFLLHNKKWWLIPIIVVLLVLGFLVVIGGSGLSWLMYTVF